ncbi:uncharacterized protein LOC110092497 [Dendrobium catenatum]|uniref:uncharacterized protein LOC110092497 n=1 Tax=Dendrobium catenatum TaxID=906689 RepID=UPI00109FD0B3|nr:uncharacterized protein LOC110092497 [Dendrobium catenatum]
MAEEFIALQKQGTWTLVPVPINAPILGSKWTYRTKCNSDGSVARFKARLVAQGNQQEYALDYNDTFCPVAKLPTIRILFAVALFYQWPVQQLDVSNALHGNLTETNKERSPFHRSIANPASIASHTEVHSGILHSHQSNQIVKVLKANGFIIFLDPQTASASSTNASVNENTDPNQDSSSWLVIDQNLAAALCSTISPSVLSYVLHLESTNEIWCALQTRFQSSNRSKVIQLTKELHNVSMKNLSMSQYLTEIKKIVDSIASAGSSVDPEDVMIYILNGLPPSYLPFTTSIRTMQSSLSLGSLYAL